MTDDKTLSRPEIARFDTNKVYEIYEGWPSNAEEAWKLKVDVSSRKYSRVIYIGLGGSATAGDVISDWFLSSGGVEVSVFRGFLPEVKLDDALVVVCSTSGETQETLRLAKIVAEQKRHIDLVTISAGGTLMEFSQSKGLPHVRIKMAGKPRFSLASSLFASIAVLRSASLLEGFEWEVDEAISNLKKTGRAISSGVPESENPAKSFARNIWTSDLCVYSSSVSRSVATRFKAALNENVKIHAHCDNSPELFHNEIESWEYPSGRLGVVFLRRASEPQSEARLLDTFTSVLKGKSVKVQRLDGSGEGNLSQLMTLCYTADFASYYAAIIRGVQPYPIQLIDELKRTTADGC